MTTAFLTTKGLRTPKAAAISGLIFSVLATVIFGLLWISVPSDPKEPGLWLHSNTSAVKLALNLVPFCGLAFLWFVGVLRDRLGEFEDRFFATVFLGSAFLLVGALFVGAALAGGILIAFESEPELPASASFHVTRATAFIMMNVYVVKMACVFMITTSTLAIYTAIVPRWLAFLGYGLAVLILLTSYVVSWSFLVFPAWVFLTSVSILLTNRAQRSTGAVAGR